MNNICIHIECNEPVNHTRLDLCQYHFDGGIFGSGETYEQYQIIEHDFIEYIKFVPLASEHLNVHSPMLRDIIIRTCVQIEIFFKEWLKYDCSLYPPLNQEVIKKYNKVDKNDKDKKIYGARSWTFGDYFEYKSKFIEDYTIHVMPLNINISPMDSWISVKGPSWWQVYNGIKHSGHSKEKSYNLKVALYALAALYLMHCTHGYANRYLSNFTTTKVSVVGVGLVRIIEEGLATPLDSKKYLFKLSGFGENREYIISTNESRNNIIS